MNANKMLDLPHDLASEAATIGSMIISEGAVIPDVIERVNVNDFFDSYARKLFAIIVELWSEKKPWDAVAIRNKFSGDFEENGLYNFLCKCLDSVPTPSNGGYYAQCVKDKSIERQLIGMVEDMRNEIIDSSMPLKDKFISISKLLNAEELLDTGNDLQMANLIDDYFLRAETSKGLPTGFVNIDRMVSLKRGSINIVAGPSSMGKSSFLLDMFIYHLRLGVKPYMVSLEMYPDEITERMIRNIARVESGFDKQDPDVVATMSLIASWDGSLCQKRDSHINEICTNVLAKRKKDNIGIAYIDHLHLINGVGKSRYEQMTYISNALKSLAMKAEIPVVVAAQLSRAPRQRNDHRPFMSDLRDSGSIEQDSDVVMLLFSEDYYRKQDEANPVLDGEAECIVAKNRNGKTGTARLMWFPQFSSFADLAPSYEYENEPEPEPETKPEQSLPF